MKDIFNLFFFNKIRLKNSLSEINKGDQICYKLRNDERYEDLLNEIIKSVEKLNKLHARAQNYPQLQNEISFKISRLTFRMKEIKGLIERKKK